MVDLEAPMDLVLFMDSAEGSDSVEASAGAGLAEAPDSDVAGGELRCVKLSNNEGGT